MVVIFRRPLLLAHVPGLLDALGGPKHTPAAMPGVHPVHQLHEIRGAGSLAWLPQVKLLVLAVLQFNQTQPSLHVGMACPIQCGGGAGVMAGQPGVIGRIRQLYGGAGADVVGCERRGVQEHMYGRDVVALLAGAFPLPCRHTPNRLKTGNQSARQPPAEASALSAA